MMIFNDPFADRQPNPCSFIFFLTMKTLEYLKNAFAVLRVKANTIVGIRSINPKSLQN